jgi:sugar-specific transcriptional regulator TrmB
MDRGELVDVLEEAGLSPYQADAYVTILELGAAPATEIVKASNVPDPRIYDVLRDLESAGYVELYEQDSLHARAHDLDVLRDDLTSRATRFTDAADEIEHRWEQPSIEEGVVSIVKRFETVLNRADEFVQGAANQVEASLNAEHYQQLRSALRTAKENGANVKISFSTGDVAGWDALPSAEEIAEVATEVRYRDIPSPFVVTVDRTKACFVPHAGSANVYGIIVDDRTHTYVFHWFFLTTQWDIWETYYEETVEDVYGDYIDIRYCVRDVLPLLQDGATVRVRVDGYDTENGRDRTVEGTVSDVVISGSKYKESDQVATYGGQVALIIETDDGAVEVGGWGAMIEELEAHRMQILSVE